MSNVDVKNLLQRMIRLEEYLKERKDRLQKTVNVLATNFEQTKRVFDEKCEGHGKDCKNIRIKLMRLSDTSERIAMNPYKRKFGISKKNHSVASCRIRSFAENVFNKF